MMCSLSHNADSEGHLLESGDGDGEGLEANAEEDEGIETNDGDEEQENDGEEDAWVDASQELIDDDDDGESPEHCRALVEAEDDMPEVLTNPDGSERAKLPTKIHDHPEFGEFYVSRLVKQIGAGHELVKITARVGGKHGGRVAHERQHNAASTSATGTSAEQPENEQEGLQVFDTVAFLVQIKKQPVLLVGDIKARFDARGHKADRNKPMPLAELADPRTQVEVRPRRLDSVVGDAIKLSFEFGKEVCVSGLVVAPITLQMLDPTAFSDSAEGTDISSLRRIGEHLRDLATARNVPLKQVDPGNEYKVPMSDHLRSLMNGSSADSLLAIGPRSASEQATSSYTCALCAETLSDPLAALNHTAYHTLCTPDMLRAISTPDPCPLCLGSECAVFLLKGSSSGLQPRICCNVWAPASTAQHPELGVQFAAARMSSSSAAAPTAIHPIACPKCHPELTDTSSSKRKSTKRPAVMSYNFLAHWDAHHRSATIPAEMKTEIALAANETAMLKLNRGKKLSKAQMVRFTANN